MTSGAPTRLVLIRHGETVGNRQNLWTGWSDTPLTDAGWQQIRRTAARLGREPMNAVALYGSPIGRAWRTAVALSRATGLHPVACDSLKEMHFGDLETIHSQQFPTNHPAVYARWKNRTDEEFGWPGGETRRAFRARVISGIIRLAAAHPGQVVLVVTHSGVIRITLAHLLPERYGEWWRVHVENCSLTHLLLDRTGRVQVPVFNDASHL